MDNLNIEYEIEQLGIHKEYNGFSNVIFEVRMTVIGSLPSGEKQNIFYVLHIDLNSLKRESFVQLQDVTKNHVLQWISINISPGHFNQRFEELFYPRTYYYTPSFAKANT